MKTLRDYFDEIESGLSESLTRQVPNDSQSPLTQANQRDLVIRGNTSNLDDDDNEEELEEDTNED